MLLEHLIFNSVGAAQNVTISATTNGGIDYMHIILATLPAHYAWLRVLLSMPIALADVNMMLTTLQLLLPCVDVPGHHIIERYRLKMLTLFLALIDMYPLPGATTACSMPRCILCNVVGAGHHDFVLALHFYELYPRASWSR